jgi:hypothetical protein
MLHAAVPVSASVALAQRIPQRVLNGGLGESPPRSAGQCRDVARVHSVTRHTWGHGFVRDVDLGRLTWPVVTRCTAGWISVISSAVGSDGAE